MRKRTGIRHFQPPPPKRFSEAQVARLLTPIHMAIELLPLGLYTVEHAHDLAAFLTISQLAAEACNRPDMVGHGSDAAMVLLAMRDRVEAGKGWNVTADERERLMRAIVAIDRWFADVPLVRWQQAVAKAYRIADRELARGAKPLEMIVEAA